MAAQKNPDKKYFVLRDGAVAGYFVGDEVQLIGHSQEQVDALIESGDIGTSAPKTADDGNVPPTDSADATLSPGRRSREATGQPKPEEKTS